MQTPNFWKYKCLKSDLLMPLSVLYYIIQKSHERKRSKAPYTPPIPTICVGNATAGGAGKTPTCIALTTLLQTKHTKVTVVSKGYKGKHTQTIKVDPAIHSALDVGDEPLLIASHTTCFVCKNRKDGIEHAVRDGADIIILDDGLQDPSIISDFTLLVVNGSYGFGNELLLPSGPLRQKLRHVLQRSNAAIIIGHDVNDMEHTSLQDLEVLHSNIIPITEHNLDIPYVAFAGIGLPEKFFLHLRGLGLDIIEEHSFPDHHNYSNSTISRLLDVAAAHNGKLITTAKDLTRIDPRFHDEIEVHDITLHLDDTAQLESLLKQHKVLT